MPSSQHLRWLWLAGALLAAGWGWPPAAAGNVVVLANRTAAKVDFTLIQPNGTEQRYSLAPREVMPIPIADKAGIAFDSGGTPRRYLLRANTIQFFVTRGDKLDMVEIGLPESTDDKAIAPVLRSRVMASVGVVPVKLLVDDGEPTVQQVWEKRLRDRLKEASDIIQRHCRIRLEVVAVDTWVSDSTILSFEKSLREFESKVKPAPALLAIGFTSKYKTFRGRTDMGGTRGPLRSHILIREWSQYVSMSERLEILVHELGHFLGAAHSAEGDSVMRPQFGDHRSNARSFRIGFDPINTFAMYLLGEELRMRPLRGLADVSPSTKLLLRSAYLALAQAMPADSAAERYLKLLDHVPLPETPQSQPKQVSSAGGSGG